MSIPDAFIQKNKVIYMFDEKLCTQINRLPCVLNRGTVVHDLIKAYGLINDVSVVNSVPATEEELKLCHSSSYINYIKLVSTRDESDDEEQDEFGLSYDCPILENLFEFVTTIAGGSLTAANYLINEKCDIAINWFGGWHHAQRDEAEGFCYVNDVAIAIQQMSKKFKKIMYIDFDIHHGNGVQNLFETSQRILTLSFHKHMPGFYPGSGSLEDIGCYKGKYYSLNVPFLEGLGNDSLQCVFDAIFPRIYEKFQPNAFVVQCGSDGINGDPIGQCNLTPVVFGHCVKSILNCKIPCLFLGGGGYNFANTARNWTYLTSVIVGKELHNDIPEDSVYFMEYRPDFELEIIAGNQKDTNSEHYLKSLISTVHEHCQNITTIK